MIDDWRARDARVYAATDVARCFVMTSGNTLTRCIAANRANISLTVTTTEVGLLCLALQVRAGTAYAYRRFFGL